MTACATPAERASGLSLREDHPEPDLVSARHVVRSGQTLYRIARAYGLTVDELEAANQISDPTTLRVGQELVIPGATQEVPLEAPAAAAPDPPAPADPEERTGTVKAQPVKTAPPDDPRHGTLAWPLRGVLYGRFGKKGKTAHDGIDLAAPTGTAVKTAREGTVLYAGEQPGYGRIVIVEHEGQLVTLYAHNRDLKVKAGQRVHAGEVIATVGESGRTTGPHLHFEVRKAGAPVNPLDYLGPVPAS